MMRRTGEGSHVVNAEQEPTPFPKGIGAPATRALTGAGYTSLESLAGASAKDLTSCMASARRRCGSSRKRGSQRARRSVENRPGQLSRSPAARREMASLSQQTQRHPRVGETTGTHEALWVSTQRLSSAARECASSIKARLPFARATILSARRSSASGHSRCQRRVAGATVDPAALRAPPDTRSR